MIKKICDLCGRETNKDYSEKFDNRNPNASFYLVKKIYGKGAVGEFKDIDEAIICNRCCSEDFSKKIDKIDEETEEMIYNHSMKLWRKLRGIKKLPKITNKEHYCIVCHTDLNGKHCWGSGNGLISEEDLLCDSCHKFDYEVSYEGIRNPKFKNFFIRELKKICMEEIKCQRKKK